MSESEKSADRNRTAVVRTRTTCLGPFRNGGTDVFQTPVLGAVESLGRSNTRVAAFSGRPASYLSFRKLLRRPLGRPI